MWTYLVRRILWMIPTFMGVLIVNFAMMQMRSGSLMNRLNEAPGGEGSEGAMSAETRTAGFRERMPLVWRENMHLPALLNFRGFTTKADLVAWLESLARDTRSADQRPEDARTPLQPSRRNEREVQLWISGEWHVEPLMAILQDDDLAELHGPASQAFLLCAYRPLLPTDPDTLPADEYDAIAARNRSIEALGVGIPYEHDDAGGFSYTIDDQTRAQHRQALLDFWDEHQHAFKRTWGSALGDMVLETGFMAFMTDLFTGQLYSHTRQRYVFELIAERWYVTFWLQFLSIFIAWTVSIGIGIRSARRKGTLEDGITTNTLFLLWSLPSFFVAALFLNHLCVDTAYGWRIFPNIGLSSDGAVWLPTPVFLMDLAWHGCLPLIVMTYSSFTALSRYMRGNLLDQLNQDYVRTAYAKGADENRVVYDHAMRNSLITMITLGAGLLSSLFASSIVVEKVFTIQGLSLLTLNAALNNDMPLLMGSVIISVLLMMLGILIADMLYAVVDPRIRSRYG